MVIRICPIGSHWPYLVPYTSTPQSPISYLSFANFSFAISFSHLSRMSSERVALVTGAGSGIGRAVVLTFFRHRYRVVLAARRLPALREALDIGKADIQFIKSLLCACPVQPTEKSCIPRYRQWRQFSSYRLFSPSSQITCLFSGWQFLNPVQAS